MTPLQLIQIIIGLALALFLPGYILARIILREMAGLEKIALGFVLSIALDIIVGLFLGYNKYMKNLTGGITALNLWIYLGGITLILLMLWAIIRREEFESAISAIKGLFAKE